MDTSFIHGVIPPIVTPVDSDENIDHAALGRQVDYVIGGGVHGILAFGSNGEFWAFDQDEQQRGLHTILERTAGRVPVYMGVGGTTTKGCLKMTAMAEREGAQAITILPPMFLAPNDDELFEHYRAIAASTSLPVLLYNNPGRVGYGVSADLAVRLFTEIDNLVGAKDSSGNMTLTAEYIRRTQGQGFRVMAGRDTMILATLVYGGVGCVASTANIVPELVVSIYNRYNAGDLEGAREAQFALSSLRMLFDKASFPVATKDAANIAGLDVGPSILPNMASSPKVQEELRQVLRQLGKA